MFGGLSPLRGPLATGVAKHENKERSSAMQGGAAQIALIARTVPQEATENLAMAPLRPGHGWTARRSQPVSTT